MANVETVTKSPAQEVAVRLVERLLKWDVQLPLYVDYEEAQRQMYDDLTVRRLQADNPDKLIVPADKIREFRHQAAYAGAGFAPAEYEGIMYHQNDPNEVGRLVPGFWYGRQRIPARSATFNLMRDEVENEIVSSIVPTSEYDLSSKNYVTSVEDLQKVFEFDYENLAACRRLDFDMLYERED